MTREQLIIDSINEGEDVTFREGSVHDAPTVRGVVWVDSFEINLSYNSETRDLLLKIPELKKYIPSWLYAGLTRE